MQSSVLLASKNYNTVKADNVDGQKLLVAFVDKTSSLNK
jgi:hypothetical protein